MMNRPFSKSAGRVRVFESRTTGTAKGFSWKNHNRAASNGKRAFSICHSNWASVFPMPAHFAFSNGFIP